MSWSEEKAILKRDLERNKDSVKIYKQCKAGNDYCWECGNCE